MQNHISVVIPTFRREKLLLRSLQYILPQLHEQDEVIVCNDDREGNSCGDIIKSLNDGRVTLVNNDAEKGPASTRNIGASHAKNNLILFLDDDDILVDGYLQSLRQTLDEYPEADYGYSNIEITYGTAWQDKLKKLVPEVASPVTKSKDKLFGACCGFWIKKGIFEKVGKFDVTLWNSEDNDLCARLHAAKFKCLKFQRKWVLVCRSHQDGAQNITSRTQNSQKVKCWWMVYSKNSKNLPLTDGVRVTLLERFIRRAVKFNLTDYAAKKMSQNLLDPLMILGFLYLGGKYISKIIKQKN